jgi:hypothetical protein
MNKHQLWEQHSCCGSGFSRDDGRGERMKNRG